MHIGCRCVFPAQMGGVELEIRRGRRRPHERGADEKGRTTRDMGSAGPCAAIARWGPASHRGRLVLRMQTHERSPWIDARSICIRNDSKAKEPPCSSLGYASTEHATARARLLQPRQITSAVTSTGSLVCVFSSRWWVSGPDFAGCDHVSSSRAGAAVTSVGLGMCEAKRRRAGHLHRSMCILGRCERAALPSDTSYMHTRQASTGRGRRAAP
jgi:hypothetical protein